MDNQNNKQRILIVDDRPLNIQVIGMILRKKGFLISIAGSGNQALKIIEQNPPDLILLDILMPDMDGYEVCCRLKENSATREIPVIFMSALTDNADRVKGLRLGAVDYISKPVEPEVLLVRINTHLKVKSLYKELEEINTKLEENVRIRTMELTRKNEALEREIEILKEREYIIESASIAIVFAALDGMITYANPAFLKTWGYDNNREVLGRHFSEFWVTKDIFEKIMDTLQNKGGWSDRIKARKKHGTIFDVHILAAVVFDKAGNPVSVMASSIDLTKGK